MGLGFGGRGLGFGARRSGFRGQVLDVGDWVLDVGGRFLGVRVGFWGRGTVFMCWGLGSGFGGRGIRVLVIFFPAEGGQG